MQSSFSIVRQDQFIKATRDSGYKGTASALSELIDNSIQAGATKVHIRLIGVEQEATGLGRPRMSRVVEVGIADNGRGMNGELLRRAVRFGDSDRFNDRSGLGRFGMGLPNASVSQCKRFEVFSRQKGQETLWTYVDVEEVAAEEMVEIPEPVEAPIPVPYEDLVDTAKGTLVVWRDCDRLDHDGKLETLVRSLRPALGRIFRHFLVADFEITINGVPVEPFDPLYLMPEARLSGDLLATQHGDTLKFQVPIPSQPDQTSTVEVQFSLLPEQWQVNFNKDKKELQRRHIDDSRGFSIVRARREIDISKSPYHAKHWTDTWYRVEMHFEPELDEVFGVTHTKQHASIRPGTMIYEKLREAVTANVNTMKDMIVARGKKAHEVRTKQAEEAAQRVEPRLKPIEGLAEKPQALVEQEVQKFVEQHAAQATQAAKLDLEDRLSKYTVLIEYEDLPGAPFYRIKMVGRSIVILLNTHHRFYERCYHRLEAESPLGKTGIDLLLMALGRSEALGSEEARSWYDDQRHEWSQHIKAFLDPIDEPDPDDVEVPIPTAGAVGYYPLRG
jgi:hypothetical protein